MNKGFRVAVGLLENQLKEVQKKKMYLEDQSRMIQQQQNYEIQALQEIAGKIMSNYS